MSQQPPPVPTASAVSPCPTVIQIVGRPGTGSLPSTIAPFGLLSLIGVYTFGLSTVALIFLGLAAQSFISIWKFLFKDYSSLTVLTKVFAVLFFCRKIVRSFCSAKAPHIFFSKKEAVLFFCRKIVRSFCSAKAPHIFSAKKR